MTHPFLDDPGELIRFWLWHERHHTVRSFTIVKLATDLHATPKAVAAWLTRHAIPTPYWNRIARHFGRQSYRQLEDEARVLWQQPAHRRGYTPLFHLQKRRRWSSKGHTATGRVA